MATRINLSSAAFFHGEAIPSKYTCEGENINPPLTISDLPKQTASLVVIVEDPDAPGGLFNHWTVWNIPPHHTTIIENERPGMEGMNSFGKPGYGGPCPPSGTHRYFFRIYALSTILELPPDANSAHVKHALRQHLLAEGELMGTYSRKK